MPRGSLVLLQQTDLAILVEPRHSFVMVKGAALLLQEEEKLEALQESPAPSDPKQSGDAAGQQELHLQQMVGLLRPQDAIRLVR
ncbi:UNVERIFIED_CONTAM: hypothetical protein K2H54_007719 [Gekko kuhli]